MREGFLVVSVTLLGDRGLRLAPVPVRRRRPARPPDRRVSRGNVGDDDHRRERGDRLRRAVAIALDVAPVHPVARRDGDHRPRDRGAAAPPGRRASADGVRAPGPRGRPASRADPANGAAAVGPLRRAHRRCSPLALAALGWTRHRRADDGVRSSRARVLDDAHGRVLDAAGLDPVVLRRRAVDHRPVHAHRGRELRAPLPRLRPSAVRGCSLATRSSGSIIALVLVASIALTVQIWGYDIARGEEAIRAGVFQAVSIITTTGYRDRGLRAVAARLPADDLRVDVRRRARPDRRPARSRSSATSSSGRSCAGSSTRR